MSNIATALSGLQNTSLAIDTVSNNIANANTIGYKAGEYVFATQFVNGTNTSDQPAVGQGNQSLGVRRPMTQGTITNSANPLDLAISGKGMFRMLMGSGGADNVDPTAVYYSRNGQFGVDKQGYIVNENGMYLTGYQPSLDGNKVTDDLIKNNGLLKMPAANLPGNATSHSKLSTMLDSTATAFTPTANVAFDPGQSTYNNKTTQTVFDSDGNSHTLEVYYRRVSDTSLAITSGVNGYTYTPSTASTPNTVGDSSVVINKESVLRLNMAPKASAMSTASTSGTAITLTASPTNSGSTVAVTGMKIFINGVDSGATVSAQTGASITASGSISVPSGAAVSFYDGDNAYTLATAPTTATSTLTLPSDHANVAVGDRLYMNGVDTGITVTSKSSNSPYTVTLSSAVTSTSTAAVFKHAMAMTLIAPDGTEISVTGTTNKKASLEKLTTTMAQVEVFASIDGKFFDYQDASTYSNRKLTPETPGVTG
jgi:flagellar hook protein FlgE